MNDSLRTDIFLRHMPETIACACIFLAARDLSIPLPDDPPWYEAFDANRVAVENISRILIDLYRRKKPSWSQLEARCSEAKKRLMEKQMQNKPAAEMTPSQNAVTAGAEKGSPSVSAQPSRQGSPKPRRRTDRDRDSSRRRRRSTAKNGSPRRGRSKSRSRSRSRSPRDRNLPKRYVDDYRRHNRAVSSYDSKSKNRGGSKKYESSKYIERRKR